MTAVTGFMVLNPVLQATPLNFRAWLRTSLDQYRKEQGQPGVLALLFLTPHYANAIGRKKLEKMLMDAVRKHKDWLRAINIMITPNPLSDDEAEKIVEDIIAENDRAQKEAAGTLLLGYLKPPSEEPDATPVCVIRQANERDLATLREIRSECELGDWFVMGEIDQREVLSQPIKTLEEAKEYARDFFEASSFDAGYPIPDQEGAKA